MTWRRSQSKTHSAWVGNGRCRTNIQQLRYVVATADHGSMTAAATALFVAQPALSRGVRQLERELGVTLFRRSGRGVALTSAGADVVRRARRALASIDTLHAITTPESAPLTIAASPTLQVAIAIPLLAALRERGLRVPTRLVGCASSHEVVDLVASGEADIGLCDGDVDAGALARVPLGNAEVRLYAPATADLPDRVGVGDLDGLPLVVPTSASPRRAALDAFFAASGVTPTIAVETDERNAWLATVSAGLASCIWHSVGGGLEPAPGVRSHRFDPPLLRPLSAVHPAVGSSPVVLTLLDVLRRFGAVVGGDGFEGVLEGDGPEGADQPRSAASAST